MQMFNGVNMFVIQSQYSMQRVDQMNNFEQVQVIQSQYSMQHVDQMNNFEQVQYLTMYGIPMSRY